MRTPRGFNLGSAAGFAAAVTVPILLTLLLSTLPGEQRDYVFLYMAAVAILGVAAGFTPSLLAAAISFLLVDYYFVPPVHTLTIGDHTDLVNLAAFFGAAGLVGGLGSRRRHAQIEAEALADDLRRANAEMARLSREQAEAATVAVRLAQTQQHVQLLEEGDKLRRELLANVSHELRTPLSTILIGTTALAERNELPKSARDELSTIAAQAERLKHLVADMLDMARIEGHALDLTLDEVDLGQALDAAVDRLHLTAPDRLVTATASLHGPVMADWLRLGQILDNLLANANRYAPAGAPISIDAEQGKRGMAVIRISDTGPGIAPDIRDQVFERFITDPSGQGSGQGTGLGLAIVRGLVEAHAGRIWVEDSDNHPGAHLSFTLPMALDADQAS